MKTLKACLLLAGAAGVFLGITPASAAVNLVHNPGFETGDLTDWSVDPRNGWSAYPNGAYLSPLANGGNFNAGTACVESYCKLSQILTTTPGTIYSLSFAFNTGPSVQAGGADTEVLWNGHVVADAGYGPEGWTIYTVSGLVGTGADTLTFAGYQDPYVNGLDNISVVAVAVAVADSGVPGPIPGAGFAGLAALALAGFYARTRRA